MDARVPVTSVLCKHPCCVSVCADGQGGRLGGLVFDWHVLPEICSFPLVNASLPLILPRATASPSHNHSDTISSPLLIFFFSLFFSWLTVLLTLSFHRLTIQLKCLLNLCSYCTLFKLCPVSVGFLLLSTARVLLSPWACVHLSLCSSS